MASSNAADPVFVDQKQSSSNPANPPNSTAITIPESHHPENEQQPIKIENESFIDAFLYLTIYWFYCAYFANLLTDGRTIYGLLKACDLEFYANYYIVKTLFMILLGSLFFYHYFDPRSFYFLKVVSIISSFLFVFDLTVMASIANIAIQKFFSCGAEKCFINPKLHSYVELLDYNIGNAVAMFLVSIFMSLIQVLGAKAYFAYYSPRRNRELRV